MISGPHKNGCEEILRTISGPDLSSICDTVTNRLIATTTIEETIQAIITYSSSAAELLNRKKLKHEILFQYLYSKNVPGVTAKSTKLELISRIIEFWKHQDTRVSFTEVHEPPQAPLPRSSPNITINYNTVIHQQSTNYVSGVEPTTNDTGQQMAMEFIDWFYPMLNSLKDSQSKELGAEHFWPDAKLMFTVMKDGTNSQEEFNGAQATQEKLSSIVHQENAVLNPNNTPDGYRGAISPHGHAKVAVCGTLHKLSPTRQPTEVIGIFEQCFGLLRDINTGNRWKIKYSDIKIKIMNVLEPITLSEDTKRAITN